MSVNLTTVRKLRALSENNPNPHEAAAAKAKADKMAERHRIEVRTRWRIEDDLAALRADIRKVQRTCTRGCDGCKADIRDALKPLRVRERALIAERAAFR